MMFYKFFWRDLMSKKLFFSLKNFSKKKKFKFKYLNKKKIYLAIIKMIGTQLHNFM